jgi:hypothetical protein
MASPSILACQFTTEMLPKGCAVVKTLNAIAVLKRERSTSRNPLCYQCKDAHDLVTPMNGKTFLVRTGAGEFAYRCTHYAWSIGRTQTVFRASFHCERALSGRLRPIQQVGSQVETAVPAIWADGFVTSLRDHRFRGIVQTGHSYVADLRMLEGCLTLPANKNPCGHFATSAG